MNMFENKMSLPSKEYMDELNAKRLTEELHDIESVIDDMATRLSVTILGQIVDKKTELEELNIMPTCLYIGEIEEKAISKWQEKVNGINDLLIAGEILGMVIYRVKVLSHLAVGGA